MLVASVFLDDGNGVKKWEAADPNLFEFGTWHHIALTWDVHNGLALYRNGEISRTYIIQIYTIIKYFDAWLPGSIGAYI